MLIAAFIYFGIAAGLAIAGYAGVTGYNRRRSRCVLLSLEKALDARGRVLAVQWTSPGRIRAQLQLLPNTGFRRASAAITLRTWELPICWAVGYWRKPAELMTFEADLD